MNRRARIGRWIIGLIFGTEIAYELTAFADGPGGLETESQIIKAFERAHGIAARFAVGGALIGAAIVLFTHLVWPTY